MKKMTCSILVVFVAFATSVVHGGQPPPGVAGVEVSVKQLPAKRSVTDARGNFALDGLAPGSYTIAFRAKESKSSKSSVSNKAVVATTYSIKIDGTKKAVTQSGLTSDKLLAGVAVPVEVGAGAKVRGQVLAGGVKKMVWISGALGSHIPGHWAEEDSKEASMYNRANISANDIRNNMQNQKDPHQEGGGGNMSGRDGPGR
jgi:hypothetical protein